jgi:hypothetical protein
MDGAIARLDLDDGVDYKHGIFRRDYSWHIYIDRGD